MRKPAKAARSGTISIIKKGTLGSAFFALTYCGRFHDSKHTCSEKQAALASYIRKASAADEFRQRSCWKNNLSPKVKRDAGYVCEVCKANGRYIFTDLSVHHIVPINAAPELANDERNLICVCADCHEAAEKGKLDREFLRKLAAERIRVQE